MSGQITLSQIDRLQDTGNPEGLLTLLNNDALAPVYTLLDGTLSEQQRERQIEFNFYTDQAERAKERHFITPIEYVVAENDLLTNNGESLVAVTQQGLKAALYDAERDPRLQYGVDYAKACLSHPEFILRWYKNAHETRPLIIASLCPDEKELPIDLAHEMGRKPERQMASMWLFEKTPGKIQALCFSLDSMTLADLETLRAMGIFEGEGVAADTIQQLKQPLLVSGAHEAGLSALEHIRLAHDECLMERTGFVHHFGIKTQKQGDAFELAKSRPEAYDLHRTLVEAVKDSLLTTKPTPSLRSVIAALCQPFDMNVPQSLLLTDEFREHHARQLLDYVRTQAIPHYLHSSSVHTTGIVGFTEIAQAGARAAAQGVTYSGECPTSSVVIPVATSQTLGELYNFSKNVEYQECVTCPFCKKTVTSKRDNIKQTLECYSGCKAKIDLKTGRRIDNRFRRTGKTMLELIMDALFAKPI